MQLNRTLNKQVKSRFKRAAQSIFFYDEKIVQTIDKKEISYSWNQVIEVNETRKFLYLYISKISAIIVNKETLDEKDLIDLKSLIKIKIGRITYYKNK